MEKYKPEYLGKVMPIDNPSNLTDFFTSKYDSFSKIYDVCKDQSNDILDIKTVNINANETESLSVKISAVDSVYDIIKDKVKNDPSVSINNDVITAKVLTT